MKGKLVRHAGAVTSLCWLTACSIDAHSPSEGPTPLLANELKSSSLTPTITATPGSVPKIGAAINIVAPVGTTYVKFPALPSAICHLHDTQTLPGLKVVTDGDGVGGATLTVAAGAPTAALTLDCVDRNGNKASQSLTLSVGPVYVEPRLPPSTAQYTVTPPLAGDPLAWSQSQLTSAGYPPRPDDVGSDAYVNWRAIVSKPIRTLANAVSLQSAERGTVYGAYYAGGHEARPNVGGSPSQYEVVSASWTVPFLSPTYDTYVWVPMLIWVGINADISDVGATNNDLIQVGTDDETYTVVEFGGYYFFQTDIPFYESLSAPSNGGENFWGTVTTAPGHQITAMVWTCVGSGDYTPTIVSPQACYWFDDATAGVALKYYLPILDNVFSGRDAWWIMERRPAQTAFCGGGQEVWQWPDFGTMQISSLYAAGGDYSAVVTNTMTQTGSPTSTLLSASTVNNSTHVLTETWKNYGADYCLP